MAMDQIDAEDGGTACVGAASTGLPWKLKLLECWSWQRLRDPQTKPDDLKRAPF